MNYYTLKTHNSKQTLYAGYFKTFTDCLETAVSENIDLRHIDLRGRALTNANLDGANMDNALFTGTNLTGANMSECSIQNSVFENCSVYNTCFSYSDLQGSNFAGCNFGGTLIEGSQMKDCMFSTLSCFDLEFSITAEMQGCSYIDVNKEKHAMSFPPIILKGLISSPIIIFDETVKIGSLFFNTEIVPTLNKFIEQTINMNFRQIEQKKTG